MERFIEMTVGKLKNVCEMKSSLYTYNTRQANIFQSYPCQGQTFSIVPQKAQNLYFPIYLDVKILCVASKSVAMLMCLVQYLVFPHNKYHIDGH